eukprot:3418093-Rhodomonas_salina.2
MDRSMAYMATLYTLESAGGGSFTPSTQTGGPGLTCRRWERADGAIADVGGARRRAPADVPVRDVVRGVCVDRPEAVFIHEIVAHAEGRVVGQRGYKRGCSP